MEKQLEVSEADRVPDPPGSSAGAENIAGSGGYDDTILDTMDDDYGDITAGGSHKGSSMPPPSSRNMSVGTELACKLLVTGISGAGDNYDEVFIEKNKKTPAVSPAGGFGTKNSLDDDGGERFPPAYHIIRAQKAKALGAVRMAGMFNLLRLKTDAKLGYGRGGLAVSGDRRSAVAQHYHCAQRRLNLSMTLKKPDPSKFDDLICTACPLEHSLADRMAGGGAANSVDFI
jgi:hypothetical protein